jgi:hypothetical protein
LQNESSTNTNLQLRASKTEKPISQRVLRIDNRRKPFLGPSVISEEGEPIGDQKRSRTAVRTINEQLIQSQPLACRRCPPTEEF